MSNVFRTVICGVDGSSAGIAAARTAARVVDPDGKLVLVAVENAALAVHAGWGARAVMDQLEAEAKAAAESALRAVEDIHPAATAVVEGDPSGSLLREADEREATLLVVGAREHSRALGILLGSVATTLLHEAPCSVLVARETVEDWPHHIIVGVDGSSAALDALDAARVLAVRFRVPIRSVEEPGDDPVDGLAALAEPSDMLVVGSRGLKGVRALGSVSERLAHHARCPVLVVRGRGAGRGGGRT